MALRQTFTWLCTLAVLSLSASQDETLPKSCSSTSDLLEQLSSNLQKTAECSENLSSDLNSERTASLLLSMRNLTEILHRKQLTECSGAEPRECPDPEVPDNGGLACIIVNGGHFCKPLCNHGHDFSFIRMSRVFEECSNRKGNRWTTQFIGGNKLAECQKSAIQLSASTAYFPVDCLTTKTNSQRQEDIFNQFTNELIAQGIEGKPQSKCLVCGKI